jgi:hypothetical protein
VQIDVFSWHRFYVRYDTPLLTRLRCQTVRC